MIYYALENTTTGGYFTGDTKLCHPPIYLTSSEQKHAQVSRCRAEMENLRTQAKNRVDFTVVEINSLDHKHLAD